MKAHCALLMVHAPANDQFRDIKACLKNHDPDMIIVPAPLQTYLNDRGWLRSTG